MNITNMSFATVIVTYGTTNRLSGLIRTIESTILAGSEKIYLVNNGCQYDVHSIVQDKFKDIELEVIDFSKNSGSSKGFSAGVKAALDDLVLSDDRYVLILDDDVILDKDLKKEFIKVENTIESQSKHIWSLTREGRDHTFSEVSDRNINYYNNSIASFSVFNTKAGTLDERTRADIARPFFIPWAGTLIRKDVLKKIELPKSDYFVYEDDADFSLNIRESGYDIYKSEKLILRESSSSWFENNGEQQSGYKLYYNYETNPGRFLYKIRNNTYLIKNRLLTNRFYFYCNIVIFMILGFFRYGILKKQSILRLKMLFNAVRDGLRARLGENNNWKL